MSFSSSTNSSSNGFVSSAIRFLLISFCPDRRIAILIPNSPNPAEPLSMNAVAHLERRWIGAEPANRDLPHARGVRVEDESGIDIPHEPRGLGQFFIGLAWPPPRVAGQDHRARRG